MANELVVAIGPMETKRSCAECLKPATKWVFKRDQKDRSINLSARRPVCEEHTPAE